MNQNLPGVPNVPYHNYSHQPRRDYYAAPHHHPNQYPYVYHHPNHYQPPPPHQYQQQHWSNPYNYHHPNQSHYPRHYQPQSPLVVSSYPSTPNPIPVPRQLPQPFQPSQPPRTPHDGNPTPPTSSSQPGLSSASTTPSNADLTAPHHHAVPEILTPPENTVLDPPPSTERMPFYPPLPWFSVDESSFPPKPHRRRRKRRTPQATQILELPFRASHPIPENHATEDTAVATSNNDEDAQPDIPGPVSTTIDQTLNATQSSMDSASADPATPDSSLQTTNQSANNMSSAPQRKGPPKPVVPIIPIAPQKSQRETSPLSETSRDQLDSGEKTPVASAAQLAADPDVEQTAKPEQPPSKPTAKSWAELLRSQSTAASSATSAYGTSNGVLANGPPSNRAESSADIIRNYSVGDKTGVGFLEPRGLVNTGNMCYMNSILQVLVFCAPFYSFLEEVGQRAVHSFKSETPLIEALILFMREFSVINSAPSVEQLRSKLRDGELEQYGEPFTPEFVYEVIRKLPRFSAMRRGHQQDAEEFLGFLLQGLHDECAQIMNKAVQGEHTVNGSSSRRASDANSVEAQTGDGGWLEVGPKQKPSVTRSSGEITTESPITKIFGGKLRSEFRVPGMKNSVTLEPYQPLQLDIGDPGVSNIVDALKGLTRPETIQGNFQSPRGPGTNAVKQVFIETLPPVLILHLKRFQYDNAGGTQKIWKKIGYPLELEIPKEVFAQNKRSQLGLRPGGLPKYRLISVVYHHGKSATGGHYTVDVRRQEGGEWIRLDDTVIRRVRSEDVAKEGGEEDPKILAAALENHKREQNPRNNIYTEAGLDNMSTGDNDDQGEWNKVNGRPTSPKASDNKKWSAINGTTGSNTPSTTGKRTPRDIKSSVKDNKIAYILFYQQV